MRLTHCGERTRVEIRRLRRELALLAELQGTGWTHFLDPRGCIRSFNTRREARS